MYKSNKLSIKIISSLILVSAVITVASAASAQIKIPGRAAKVLPANVITSRTQDGRLHLKIVYLSHFKLNEKVPDSKRILLTLDTPEKTTFSTSSFSTEKDGAELYFPVPTSANDSSVSASLKVYLCRPDQCQVFRKTLVW